VYAQKGGAAWITELDDDADGTRLKNWKDAIAEAVTDGALPASLNELTNPDATPQQQLDAFIACHQYQDTLLELSISIAKKLAGLPATSLSLQEAAKNITKITESFDKTVGEYALDVGFFLNLQYDNSNTDKISYLVSGAGKVRDIIMEPNIFKNMFIHSLANIFIAAKYDDTDIKFLKTQNAVSTQKSTISLFGRNWDKYTSKQSVEYTGKYLTGSFYLTQKYDEFKSLLHPAAPSLTFFEHFAVNIINQTNSIKVKECKNYYGNEPELWVNLTSDLFNTYMASPRITIKEIIELFNINHYDVKSCKKASSDVRTDFAPNDSIDLPILGTEVSLHALLLQLDAQILSFLLHFMYTLEKNETLLMKQIEASGDAEKLADFKGKFGRT
jgi:hypothetical protein